MGQTDQEKNIKINLFKIEVRKEEETIVNNKERGIIFENYGENNTHEKVEENVNKVNINSYEGNNTERIEIENDEVKRKYENEKNSIKNVDNDTDKKNFEDNFEKEKYGGNVVNEMTTNGNYPNKSEKRKENDENTSLENKK